MTKFQYCNVNKRNFTHQIRETLHLTLYKTKEFRPVEVGGAGVLKSNFLINSIAQKTNKLFDKILPYKGRAKFCQIFCPFFGQWSFNKKYLWDLLTFTHSIPTMFGLNFFVRALVSYWWFSFPRFDYNGA